MSHSRLGLLVAAGVSVALPASAERIAVLGLEVPGASSVAVQASRVATLLAEHGHRVVSPGEASDRLGWTAADVGPEWAARQLRAIDSARAALTRLDWQTADALDRTTARDIVAHGGGASGSEVLVEWCLLEHEMAAAAGDAVAAKLWLDRAAATGESVAIDAARHPSDEVQQFERRRATLRSEPAATVAVATVPPGADVWIDGVRKCSSPCNLTLMPGRHLALLSMPRYAPVAADWTLGAGSDSVRKVALSAAHSGQSPAELGRMWAAANRRSEAATALEPAARFLDVNRVVALAPEGNGMTRVLVSPPATGRSRLGPLVGDRALEAAVLDQLRPAAGTVPDGSERSASDERADLQAHRGAPGDTAPWYAKPAPWIVGGAAVAVFVGTVLIVGATRPPTGTLTISSPP